MSIVYAKYKVGKLTLRKLLMNHKKQKNEWMKDL